jgi:hypothetical protein
VIARLWHGWTKPEDGSAYEEFLRADIFPALADRVPGFRGGYVLRRDAGGEDEFLVMTLFDSLEAVHTFAGDDHEVPVIEPEAGPPTQPRRRAGAALRGRCRPDVSDAAERSANSHTVARWTRGESPSQPRIHKPRNEAIELTAAPVPASTSVSKPVATIALRPRTATSAIPTRPSSGFGGHRAGIADDQRHRQSAREQRKRPARAPAEGRRVGAR